MGILVPCLSKIECRWRAEVIQKPVLREVDGQLKQTIESETIQRGFKLGFDWFEQPADPNDPEAPPPEFRFLTEVEWPMVAVPASSYLNALPAASDIIDPPDSVYKQIASALYTMFQSELQPAATGGPVGVRSYVPAFAPSKLRINLPYHLPHERTLELEVAHFLDEACTFSVFSKKLVRNSRAWLAARQLNVDDSCENLLNNETIEPFVMNAIQESATRMKAAVPAFNIDIPTWMQLVQGVIDSLIV